MIEATKNRKVIFNGQIQAIFKVQSIFRMIKIHNNIVVPLLRVSTTKNRELQQFVTTIFRFLCLLTQVLDNITSILLNIDYLY